MPTVDFHQHLWPEPLVAELGRRRQPPRLRGSLLDLAGEGTCEVDLRAHDLDVRLELLDRLEIEVAVVSLPPTLGFDQLPDGDRRALVEAYDRGIQDVAAASGGRIVPLAADRDDRAFAGVCVGAPDLLELERLAPWLDDVEERGVFVFVHPGPARRPPGAPEWWPAVVEYTAQMQAAYGAWLAGGAARWPALRVVFAILAGGGPFQLERLQSRGVAGRDVVYDNVFFETASYGRRALELCFATFGVGHVLFGSDVPVNDPLPTLESVRAFGDAVADALCDTNPSRLLT